MSNILITGAAGFIGFHLTKILCQNNHYKITGIDNLNDYYDVQLKQDRLSLLEQHTNFEFHKIDLCEKNKIDQLFSDKHFDYVVNLAAQAGVRHSIEAPYKYMESNLIGFINILEACRHFPVKHLIFASSSSVYGNSTNIPFSTSQKTDEPVSLYAATKKSNELMAHSYSALYKIPTTGLRFFTAYGPWGRPDMAYFSFTKKIMEDNPIQVFNHGKMQRDFTYIDDITQAISKLIRLTPNGETPYKLFNIGNQQPIELGAFIETLENVIGKKAIKEYFPMQPSDVMTTYADTEELRSAIEFYPNTPLKDGLEKFFEWYKEYYKRER